ncbi:MAG: hypothetical protein EAS48_02510 [Chryseobacterium sp.]|nr:MAG: hypothetical protein EAS48_02510 [Chryseobacterium sp.]
MAFACYGAFGVYLAQNFRIIYDDRIPWDAYFSFDNRSIVMTGGGWERHPLANYFFDAVRNFAELFSGGERNATFRIVLALLSAATVSLSLVQIFKYLRNIVGLPSTLNLLLVVFFGFFTTPVLLSFTPETYTYSMLFLIFYNHYAALKLKKNQSIGPVALTVAGIGIGGLTVTNIVKIYIPLLFEKGLFTGKKWLRSLAYSAISVVVFALLYLSRVNFDISKVVKQTSSQYERFSQPKGTPLWDMAASWFFGGNMLFSRFFTRDYTSPTGFKYKALFMDVYSATANYLFVGIVLALLLWSLIKNYRNRFFLILLISFLADVVIHTVLKFGLHTAYIYGGHFAFTVPMMLGWLLHNYRKNRPVLTGVTALLVLMTVYTVANNLYRLGDFLHFAGQYYR